jgi:hypothetical protein
MPINVGPEHACILKAWRLCLPSRWKYENWRISRKYTCTGSTRYGHKHHPNKKKTNVTPPVSDSAIDKEIFQRASLSAPASYHQGCYKWINCPFLDLIIMLFSVSKLTSMHMHKYFPNHKEYRNGTVNITSSTDYAQGSFEPELFRPFSSPAQWSLDYSMDTYVVCIICDV